jgi:hypothetical protein
MTVLIDFLFTLRSNQVHTYVHLRSALMNDDDESENNANAKAINLPEATDECTQKCFHTHTYRSTNVDIAYYQQYYLTSLLIIYENTKYFTMQLMRMIKKMRSRCVLMENSNKHF